LSVVDGASMSRPVVCLSKNMIPIVQGASSEEESCFLDVRSCAAPTTYINPSLLFPTLPLRHMPPISSVTVFEEEGNCIVCLEMRADELMRRLILGELTDYSVVRTSPEPLHLQTSYSSEL
jgi:hypothetical protein